MTPRGSAKLMEPPSRYVERDGHRAVVRRLGPVPADARVALHLLTPRERCAPRLAATDNVGNDLGIVPGERWRQQYVVELAEMALLGSARVIERPAVKRRPPLDDIFRETSGKQHVEAGLRFVY